MVASPVNVPSNKGMAGQGYINQHSYNFGLKLTRAV